MVKFFEELKTELKIRGYSEQTIKAYVYENIKFIEFVKHNKTNKEYQKSLLSTKSERSTQEITKQDIRAYQAYLMADKKLRPSTVNLILSSLKFFYEELLSKDILKDVKRPKREEKLPVVLSKDEIKAILFLGVRGDVENSGKKHSVDILV